MEENLLNGVKDDLYIAQEGDVLDVFQVRGQFAVPGDGVAASGLGQAAQARADGVTHALLRGHEDHIPHQLRPGANDGHVTPQNVDGLGQFVQAGCAQGLSKTGQPDLIRQQIAVFIPCVGHGAEFIQLENLFVFARSWLGKQHRAPQLDPHQDSQDGVQPTEYDERRQCTDNIKDSLHIPLVDALLSLHGRSLTQSTPG